MCQVHFERRDLAGSFQPYILARASLYVSPEQAVAADKMDVAVAYILVYPLDGNLVESLKL